MLHGEKHVRHNTVSFYHLSKVCVFFWVFVFSRRREKRKKCDLKCAFPREGGFFSVWVPPFGTTPVLDFCVIKEQQVHV